MVTVKEQISDLEDQVKKIFQKVLGSDKEMKRMKEKLKNMKEKSTFKLWEPRCR